MNTFSQHERALNSDKSLSTFILRSGHFPFNSHAIDSLNLKTEDDFFSQQMAQIEVNNQLSGTLSNPEEESVNGTKTSVTSPHCVAGIKEDIKTPADDEVVLS